MAENIPCTGIPGSSSTNFTENKTYADPDKWSIILAGETGTGKSSFGNFILRRNRFATGDSMLAITQKLECDSILYTENKSNIQFNVFDLPGLNDPRKIDTKHLTCTYNSLKQSAKFMCCVFAIIINPIDDALEVGIENVLKFTKKLEFKDLNLIDNAIVVFTHADKLGYTLKEKMEKLSTITNKSPNLQIVLKAVCSRQLLVNSLNYHEDHYWQEILELLTDICRPKFNVMLIGPFDSAKDELMKLIYSQMGDLVVVNLVEKESKPDANTNLGKIVLLCNNKHLTLTNLNTNQDNAMERITTSLTPGITSTFCILIDSSKRLTNTFFSTINSLAATLSPIDRNHFYSFSFILFIHDNNEDITNEVNIAITELDELKKLIARISNRFYICSKNNTVGCLEHIFKTSKEIRQHIYGEKYLEDIFSFIGEQNKNNDPGVLKKAIQVGIIGIAAIAAIGIGIGMTYKFHVSSSDLKQSIVASSSVTEQGSIVVGHIVDPDKLGSIGIAIITLMKMYKEMFSEENKISSKFEYDFKIKKRIFL